MPHPNTTLRLTPICAYLDAVDVFDIVTKPRGVVHLALEQNPGHLGDDTVTPRSAIRGYRCEKRATELIISIVKWYLVQKWRPQ